MTRHIKITMFVLVLLGATSGAVRAAPDAGPIPDGAAADAGAASEFADAGAARDPVPTGSNAELLAQLKELKDAYAELKSKRKSGGSIRLEAVALALSATWILIGVVRRVRKEEWTDWGKSWLPWVALGLGPVAGFLEYYLGSSNVMGALIVGAGPPLAVFFHELTKVWTKRKRKAT